LVAMHSSTQKAEGNDKRSYIPKNLQDCLSHLKILLSQDTINKIRNGNEKDVINWHSGTGAWIRNNWGLWGRSSDLYKWFIKNGVWHPDDMTGIIFHSLWRHLNKNPIKFKEQVMYYKKFWEKNYGSEKEMKRKFIDRV